MLHTSAQSRLEEARAKAEAGHFKDAITQALHIKEGSLEQEAEQAVAGWSLKIIDMARDRYAKPTNELEGALDMLRAIPGDSPLGTESQLWADRWQREWADNSRYERSAVAAIKGNDPLKASKFVNLISPHQAWTETKEKAFSEIQTLEEHNGKIAQQAKEALVSQSFEEATLLAHQLPDNSTWREEKSAIMAQATNVKPIRSWQPVMVSVGIALAVLCLVS